MKTLIIYLGKEKEGRRVIRVSEHFKGDFKELAKDLSGTEYNSHYVI